MNPVSSPAATLVRYLCLAALVCSLSHPAVYAAEPGIAHKLKGIVSFSSERLALVECEDLRRRGRPFHLLAQGEREGDFQVVKIDGPAGKVTGWIVDKTVELGFADSGPTPTQGGSISPTPSLRLSGAGTELALALYQRLAHTTVLRPAALPKIEIDLFVPEASADAQLATRLQGKFAENGILIRPARPGFVIAAGSETQLQLADPKLWDRAAEPIKTNREELVGAVFFPQTDLGQVLKVYQALTGMTVVRPAALPLVAISLWTQNPLTRVEALYALDTVLALNHISVREAGQGFVVVYPTALESAVSATITRVKASTRTRVNSDQGDLLDLAGANLAQVAAFYGQLCGQAVRVGDSTPRPVFAIQSNGMLTAKQMLYGLDLLLGVNGLAVVEDLPGTSLKIVPEAQLHAK